MFLVKEVLLLEHACTIVSTDRHIMKVNFLVAAIIEFLNLSGFTSMRCSSSSNSDSAVL